MDAGLALISELHSPLILGAVIPCGPTLAQWRITCSSPESNCFRLAKMPDTITKTVIVNMRHRKPDVACDRSSIFGNPFNHLELGITRDEVCELFIPYFYKKLTNPDFRDKVLALKGKKLGCWCRCESSCNHPKCKPLRCHLETIVNYLENETWKDIHCAAWRVAG